MGYDDNKHFDVKDVLIWKRSAVKKAEINEGCFDGVDIGSVFSGVPLLAGHPDIVGKDLKELAPLGITKKAWLDGDEVRADFRVYDKELARKIEEGKAGGLSAQIDFSEKERHKILNCGHIGLVSDPHIKKAHFSEDKTMGEQENNEDDEKKKSQTGGANSGQLPLDMHSGINNQAGANETKPVAPSDELKRYLESLNRKDKELEMEKEKAKMEKKMEKELTEKIKAQLEEEYRTKEEARELDIKSGDESIEILKEKITNKKVDELKKSGMSADLLKELKNDRIKLDTAYKVYKQSSEDKAPRYQTIEGEGAGKIGEGSLDVYMEQMAVAYVVDDDERINKNIVVNGVDGKRYNAYELKKAKVI